MLSWCSKRYRNKLRYRQQAECALTQKDRSGNDADGLQKAHYIKVHMRFRLFPFPPHCPTRDRPRQSHVRPFFSNSERIEKNIAVSLTLAPSSYQQAGSTKSLMSGARLHMLIDPTKLEPGNRRTHQWSFYISHIKHCQVR